MIDYPIRAGRKGDHAVIIGSNPADTIEAAGKSDPSVTGSRDVLINNRHALRFGDIGVRGAHEGVKWESVQGAPRVLINNQHAHRMGDEIDYHDGRGQLIHGSSNVLIGDHTGPDEPAYDEGYRLIYGGTSTPAANRRYRITRANGDTLYGYTDKRGYTSRLRTESSEIVTIEIFDDDYDEEETDDL